MPPLRLAAPRTDYRTLELIFNSAVHTEFTGLLLRPQASYV